MLGERLFDPVFAGCLVGRAFGWPIGRYSTAVVPACEHYSTIFDFVVIYPYLDVYPHILQFSLFSLFGSPLVSLSTFTSLPPHTHCFIALHAHKYFFLCRCLTLTGLALLVWLSLRYFGSRILSSFQFLLQMYIFFFFFFRPFGHSVRSVLSFSFSVACEVYLCNVYGYCNVFVGACLDNFPKLLLLLLVVLMLCSVFVLSLFHCYFSGFDLLCYAIYKASRFACASQINKIP